MVRFCQFITQAENIGFLRFQSCCDFCSPDRSASFGEDIPLGKSEILGYLSVCSKGILPTSFNSTDTLSSIGVLYPSQLRAFPGWVRFFFTQENGQVSGQGLIHPQSREISHLGKQESSSVKPLAKGEGRALVTEVGIWEFSILWYHRTQRFERIKRRRIHVTNYIHTSGWRFWH